MKCNNTLKLLEVKATLACSGEDPMVNISLKFEAPGEYVELDDTIDQALQARVGRWAGDHGDDKFSLRCDVEGPPQQYTLAEERPDPYQITLPSVITKSMSAKIDESGRVTVAWTAITGCLASEAAGVLSLLGAVHLSIEDIQQELLLDDGPFGDYENITITAGGKSVTLPAMRVIEGKQS